MKKLLFLLCLLPSFSLTAQDRAGSSPAKASNTIWVDTGGSDSGKRGRADRPFLTLSQAAAAAQAGDGIIINPGNYFDGSGAMIILTNGVYVSAAGAILTFSNSFNSTDTDIRLLSNVTIAGGVWQHISTTPGGVNGVIGAASSADIVSFTNAALLGVTINSDAACFKYTAPAADTNNSSCSFYNCIFNGTTTAFTSEGSASTLYNYIYNCKVVLTNTTTPVNNRSGFKIRGVGAGVYLIQNCSVTIADSGFSSFASAISTGKVPTGAGGFVASNSFFASGLFIDTTRCTNALSKDFNVHCETNSILLNGCFRPDGQRLTYSNYNAGLNPFRTNVYFTP